ncbi:MAG: alpha/beta hydrolase [Treponema sp.]|uniref:alpha/beta hydrolase n=1 Tax=Treponema sp. TaxID=166 RepID=UPI0025DB28E9|nr:alpha/beta hydrolase [Treponema sp.]MBQ9282852.1 alpha/beta hydrolase [Treponema sp.]
MKKETLARIKQIAIPLGILVGLFALMVLVTYLALFKPNFMRGNGKPTPMDKNHFLTKENEEKNVADTEWFYAQNPDEITVQSFDGIKLVAYNLPAENAKGTWLMIHGHQSSPLREYAGLARFFHELGYNVVLPYQRAHGKSEGKYITFGVKERYDVRDWILKINEIYGDTSPLYLEGISMGCATVLMSLSFDLPENVKSVVADCGYTSPYEIMWKVAKKDKNVPLPRLILGLGNIMAKILADFEFDEYDTFKGLRYNKLPVLFVHGTADAFVPIEMTISNYQYCTSEKYLYLVEDCPHAIAYIVDEDNYHKKLIDFCKLGQ